MWLLVAGRHKHARSSQCGHKALWQKALTGRCFLAAHQQLSARGDGLAVSMVQVVLVVPAAGPHADVSQPRRQGQAVCGYVECRWARPLWGLAGLGILGLGLSCTLALHPAAASQGRSARRSKRPPFACLLRQALSGARSLEALCGQVQELCQGGTQKHPPTIQRGGCASRPTWLNAPNASTKCAESIRRLPAVRTASLAGHL